MIKLIGLELELGISKANDFWYGKFDTHEDYEGWEATRDGSVRVNNTASAESAEIKTPPTKLSDLKQLFKKIDEIYEHVKEINETMGLHIHVSFTEKGDYSKLASFAFATHFQEKYNKVFGNKDRYLLRRTNTFCRFFADKESFIDRTGAQLYTKRGKSDQRYTAINYNAINLYKTIEFRIFPAGKKSSDVKDCVNFTIEAINEFLAKETETGIKISVKDY